jgi:hypothetical protein
MKLTYPNCQEILAKRESKKLANNTYLYRKDNVFCVKLHNTDVVTIYDDDRQSINSGGYLTKTTKDRINTFSFASVFQERGLWFLRQNNEKIPFFDGIEINSSGSIVSSQEKILSVDDLIERKKMLDKKIKQYINGFIDDALENGLGAPEVGDCLFCQIYSQNPDQISTHDFEHIYSHIEEKYYVRSLLLMAIQSRGYTNISFIWSYFSSRISCGDSDLLRQELRGFFKKYKHKLLNYIE